NATDAGADNVYNVIVTATDSGFPALFSTQSITVTVTPVEDNDPVITSNGGGDIASISLVENTTNVTTVTATDADKPGDTLTFSITGGADFSKFAITPGGKLAFVNAPDFEHPTDTGADNTYEVEVTVNDGNGKFDKQTITVTVTPGNAGNAHAPVITSAAAVSVPENTTAVTTVTASDADLPAQTVSFSITGGADAAKFSITSAGVLTFKAAPDFENPADAGGDNIYNVIVTATDSGSPPLSSTQSITVTVTPVNDNAPVITSAAAVSVPENTTAVTTVTACDADLPAPTVSFLSLRGALPISFSITSAGVLTFKAAPDFENPADAG